MELMCPRKCHQHRHSRRVGIAVSKRETLSSALYSPCYSVSYDRPVIVKTRCAVMCSLDLMLRMYPLAI